MCLLSFLNLPLLTDHYKLHQHQGDFHIRCQGSGDCHAHFVDLKAYRKHLCAKHKDVYRPTEFGNLTAIPKSYLYVAKHSSASNINIADLDRSVDDSNVDLDISLPGQEPTCSDFPFECGSSLNSTKELSGPGSLNVGKPDQAQNVHSFSIEQVGEDTNCLLASGMGSESDSSSNPDSDGGSLDGDGGPSDGDGESPDGDGGSSDENDSRDDNLNNDGIDKLSIALDLLELREKNKIPTSATQHASQLLEQIADKTMTGTLNKVCRILEQNGVLTPALKDELTGITSKTKDICSKFEKPNRLDRYIQKHADLSMGEDFMLPNKSSMTHVKIHSSIHHLLTFDDAFAEVMIGHELPPPYIGDIVDTDRFKEHFLFGHDKKALILILYADEFVSLPLWTIE